MGFISLDISVYILTEQFLAVCLIILHTYKVTGLPAEEPHCGHALNRCVDIRKCRQHRGLTGCPLFGWWGELQRDGSVWHPAAVVKLPRTEINCHVLLLYSQKRATFNFKMTCFQSHKSAQSTRLSYFTS